MHMWVSCNKNLKYLCCSSDAVYIVFYFNLMIRSVLLYTMDHVLCTGSIEYFKYKKCLILFFELSPGKYGNSTFLQARL